jgi:glycosyltransferase involved in cell wall biosynthesis
LLIAPMVPQADGSGAIPILLRAQIEALREGNEVTLVAGIGDEPGEARAAEALVGIGADIHLADRRLPASSRLRWRRRTRLACTWAFGTWPWRTVWFAAPAVQLLIDELSATSSFDVIAVEDSSMAVLDLPPGVPKVLTEHEVRRPRRIDWQIGWTTDAAYRAFREVDWRRWRAFQPAVWRRFDLVQAFTDRDAAAITALAPDMVDRIRVNPFGVMLPPVADPARERPGSVLFVGNFTHPPNRDAARWLALEIMPLIRARHASAELVIVGSGPTEDVLGLAQPGVQILADVATVDALIEAAAVIVAPVRTGGGMRMKVLEALAHGKPVVTTPRGAEGYERPGTRPPLVVAEDSQGIAAATAQLLANERCRRELGRQARAFAREHHSPTAWGKRLEAVYDEAMRHSSGDRCPRSASGRVVA